MDYLSWVNRNCRFASNMSPEYLQNEVALLLHHVEDCLSGLKEKDYTYTEKGLLDIKEVAERLAEYLPKASQESLKKIED
jgi:hypothetical protein